MKRLSIEEAAELLRENKIVALPTETVYGLAARSDREEAVRKIFQAKDRPPGNPLICHVSSIEMLERYAVIEEADRLLFRFWPGPLTLLLPRRPGIPDVVTAGSSLCAFRIPDHPIFLRIIEMVGVPLAAPSANRSGRTSPVSAEMVESSLEGRIDGIVDGGPCRYGLESTVIRRISGQKTGTHRIEILRPGAITKEMLEAAGFPVAVHSPVRPSTPGNATGLLSPGLLPAHYAPGIPLLLFEATAKEGLGKLKAALTGSEPDRNVTIVQCRDPITKTVLGDLLRHPSRLVLLLYREEETASSSMVLSAKETMTAIEQTGLTILEPAAPGDLNTFGRLLYASFDRCTVSESQGDPSQHASPLAMVAFLVPDYDIGHAINDRMKRAASARLKLRRP